MSVSGSKTQRASTAPVKTTAATTIFSAIRRDILSGVLVPGLRLRIEGLCKRFQATANPVREALNRLAAEGLVDIKDQRGFWVASATLEDWHELVRTRCLVEACALREAMKNRDEAWEDGIVLTLHRLSRTARFLEGEGPVPNPEWEKRHHAFHNALLQACGAPTLLGFCEELRERSDRYRHIASISPEARKTYGNEHKLIAEAVLEGDADLATQRLTEHYTRTLKVVEDYFSRDL